MALINCPECGKQISDRATACPNCGCPITPSQNVQQNVSQTQVTTEVPTAQKPKAEKEYYKGMVNKTHCVITSKNWYLGDDKIIPTTSVSAVQYVDWSRSIKIARIVYGATAAFSIVIICVCEPYLKIVLSIFAAIGIIGFIYYLFKNPGAIWVQTHSFVGHRIECGKQQYKECLDAMNKCLQENR